MVHQDSSGSKCDATLGNAGTALSAGL